MAPQRAKKPDLCANRRNARRKCESGKVSGDFGRCRERGLDCDPAQSLSSSTGRSSTNNKSTPTNPQATLALPPPPEAPTANQYLTSYEDSRVIKGVNRIVVGVDVGTDSSSACWASIPRTFTLNPKTVLEVINVRVEKDHRIPTEAAILPASNGAATIVYGPDVERSLSRGLVNEDDIFRLLKLGLVHIDPAETSERAEAIKQVQARQQNALSRAPRSVTNKHARPSTQLTVDSILDILEGFLAYLWNQIKRDIDKRMGLQPAELAKVLRDDIVVSIAMPAIWEDPWIDAFRKRVARAGFPNFHVVSEPKCSAAVVAHSKMRKIVETYTSEDQTKALERLKNVIMIIVDIGHGTADLTTCRIEGIDPLKMKTLFKGVGSMYGSKALNDHVKHMIKNVIGDRFETLLERVAGPDASDDALLDHFARDFDKNEKRTFDFDTEHDVNIFYPTDLPRIPGVPALKSRSVTLTAEQLMNVYKWYLPNITLQIDEQIKAIKRLGLAKDDTIEIIGVGGGTLAPCVMSLLRQYYPMYRVTSEESTECSIVAKGALLTSIDPDLGRRHFARTAYGTALGVLYDPKIHNKVDAKPVRYSFNRWRKEVPNRVVWLFVIAERIVGRETPLVLTGSISLEEKDVDIHGPIELEQPIFRTTDPSVCVSDVFDAYQTPQIHHAGTLTLPLAPHEHAFQWRPGPLGDRDVEIAFRAIPRWDGMQMYWRFVVHKTGEFEDEDVEDETGCIVKEMVLEDVLVYEEMK